MDLSLNLKTTKPEIKPKRRVGRPMVDQLKVRRIWGTEIIQCEKCDAFVQRRVKLQHQRTFKCLHKL